MIKISKLFICLIGLVLFFTAVVPAAGFHIGPMQAVEERAEELDEKVSDHWVEVWDSECEPLYEPYWAYEESRDCALDAGISMDVVDYWNSNPGRAPDKFLTKTEEYESPEKFIIASEPLGEGRGIDYGDLAWADVNRNGRLDLAVAGLDSDSTPRLVIFENLGGGEFSIAAEPMSEGAGLRSAALAWGDFNNSGYLDLAAMGYDDAEDEGSRRLIIFRNDGNFNFENAGEPLGDGEGLERGDLTWVDYSNNGMTDLVVTGFDGNNPRFIAMPNQTELEEGSEEFQTDENDWEEPFGENAGLSNYSAVAAGDFTQNGWPDLAALGWDGNNKRLVAIQNLGLENGGDTWFAGEGTDYFHELSDTAAGLDRGDLAWGDITDATGLDLAVVGRGAGNTGHIYVLQYNGKFEVEFEGNNELVGVGYSSIALGDYDNSGRVDLLVSGKDSEDTKWLAVYENEGNEINLAHEPLKENTEDSGLIRGNVAWADFSGRGRLGFAAGGSTADEERFLVFENYVNEEENIRPGKPSNIREEVYEDTVVLKWDAPVDDRTSPGSLSYLIRVETGPGEDDVISEGSVNSHQYYNRLTGRVAPPRSEAILYDLPPDSYDWRVRAVDSGYKLSRWSEPGTFEVVGQED